MTITSAGREPVVPLANRIPSVATPVAEAVTQRAPRLLRELGDRLVEGVAITNRGLAPTGLGRFDDAVSCHRPALALLRESGRRRVSAMLLAGVVPDRSGECDRWITVGPAARKSSQRRSDTGTTSPPALQRAGAPTTRSS